jgi:hypothetical protein
MRMPAPHQVRKQLAEVIGRDARPAHQPGEVGPTGQVTTNNMNNANSNAITTTSNNTNGVSALGQSADGNYNQSQMQGVLNKLDEFINAARHRLPAVWS